MERVAGSKVGRHGYYRYSGGRLYSLRSLTSARPEPTVLSPLASLGILRYRGKRGGRRKQRPIAVINSGPRYRAAPRDQASSHRQTNDQLIHVHRSTRRRCVYERRHPETASVRHLVRPAIVRAPDLPPPPTSALSPPPTGALSPSSISALSPPPTSALTPPLISATSQLPPPSIYVINANSIAKPHALEQLRRTHRIRH